MVAKQKTAVLTGFDEPHAAEVNGRAAVHLVAKFSDGGVRPFLVPLEAFGDLVAFFVGLADFFEGTATPIGPATTAVGPIPVRSLGFQAGADPTETLLRIAIPGCELALSCSSENMESLSRGIAQTARTLSAKGAKAN